MADDTALHDLTLADAAGLIKARKLSPVEYTQALLRRTDALDPQLNAYITRTSEAALEAARSAEAEIARGNWRGPLHGIPFAVKDIYDTAGVLTSGHSRICIDRVPSKDATAVAKLRAAGAIPMGKLATHEFAHGGPSFDLPWPPARNPWNTAHFTGGSSSGSGAAIAAGLVPASLGSDTGGSIRGPAGLCGIAGLKPTYGLVSRAGVLPNSYSYDHCGPMARTAQDCALILNAIAGYDAADPASSQRHPADFAASLDLGIKGLRIGVVRHFWEKDQPVSAELQAALEAALSLFREYGGHRRGRAAAPASRLFRRQDRCRRERAVLPAPAGADRQARTIRPGFQGAQPRRLPLHGRRLCARQPRTARHPGGDAAPLPALRPVRDRQHARLPRASTGTTASRSGRART